MKSLLLISVLLASTTSFATDGALASCQREAQLAVNRIAQINHLKLKTNADKNKIVLVLASGADHDDGQVIDWVSQNGQFTVTTNQGAAENSCIVEKLAFDPQQ